MSESDSLSNMTVEDFIKLIYSPEEWLRIGSEHLSKRPLVDFSYVSLCTPSYVAAKFQQHIGSLPPSQVNVFKGVCVVAATGLSPLSNRKQSLRKLVEEYLAKPDHAGTLGFVRYHFTGNKGVNMSELNLIGHCLLACGNSFTDMTNVVMFREKLGGASLWDADLKLSNISEAQRKIFEEKVGRFTADEAKTAGTRIMDCLNARSAAQE